MTQLANRMQHIGPFHVMSLLEQAKQMEAQGQSVIHMEIGEPDFPTPDAIIRAGMQALQQGQTRYTASKGLPELRQAIADYYAQRYQVNIDSARIIVTPGASGALQLALGALIGRDDEVLLADPTYPCNRHLISLVEGTPVAITTSPENGFQPSAEQIAAHWTDRTRAVMLATPANPTGSTVPRQSMQAIAELVAQRQGTLIVDEIYQGLVYEGEDYSALAVSDDCLVINSFSKFFQMTGWRLGWLIAPPDLVEPIERIAMNAFLAAPTLAQHAALAAFRPETLQLLDARRDVLRQRRDYLLHALRDMGFAIPVTPQGAFYIYADCSAVCNDSRQFAQDLLHSQQLAVTPGLDFGNNQPDRFIRFAYTAEIPVLEQAMHRLRQFLQR
ncbi:MAG: pyridoxal phosphate-dependent aminotransferase [Neisseriaceae bacterium]|nr:MAG: pyridoxal phosphate-dependent aminotransferase [Neisseriaceae bacterium]